jgi:hypothetical protein
MTSPDPITEAAAYQASLLAALGREHGRQPVRSPGRSI